VPAVREAAHQALVRIARGTDFGPSRPSGPTFGAYIRERDEAVANWRLWLTCQKDPSPGFSQD
jgi:hypothetical protein